MALSAPGTIAKQPGGRLLSPLRVVALVVALGVGAPVGVAVAHRSMAGVGGDETPAAWFAPYVDVTATPAFAFEDEKVNPASDIVLGFVVADPVESCTPSWGGAYTLDQSSSSLDLDRRIARLRAHGADIVVSFGGQANRELASACADPTKLADAYQSVVKRYDVSTVDLDVESSSLGDAAASARRANAIKLVQDRARAAGPGLAVWLTLPVGPSGLTEAGVREVDAMLAAGVDLTGVNLMTMNYGSGRAATTTMVDATGLAVTMTHGQLEGAYRHAGVPLSSTHSWAKIGITPMIGQNDEKSDRLALGDTEQLLKLVTDRGLGRLSMWSLNRDQPCDPKTTVASRANNSCSGIEQAPLAFLTAFRSLEGRSSNGAQQRTVTVSLAVPVDDPTTAPYPIWRPIKGYPVGNKVVWHGRVYQAKWWNQGRTPDTATVHDWDNAWRLIGPVLPTDRPSRQTTLPAGTYPEWTAVEVYPKGQRVLHDGAPYEAKWRTTAEPPGVDVANEWDTPWLPLAPRPGEETTAAPGE
jgi:chitinase